MMLRFSIIFLLLSGCMSNMKKLDMPRDMAYRTDYYSSLSREYEFLARDRKKDSWSQAERFAKKAIMAREHKEVMPTHPSSKYPIMQPSTDPNFYYYYEIVKMLMTEDNKNNKPIELAKLIVSYEDIMDHYCKCRGVDNSWLEKYDVFIRNVRMFLGNVNFLKHENLVEEYIVFFDQGSYRLKNFDRTMIRDSIDRLIQNNIAFSKIVLSMYHDKSDNDIYNRKIALKRIHEIKQYIRELGIPDNKISELFYDEIGSTAGEEGSKIMNKMVYIDFLQ